MRSTWQFLLVAGLVSGCTTDSVEDDDVSALEAESGSSSGAIVTQWAAIAADAIIRPVEEAQTLRPPGEALMYMAQVQNAVYDVMVAIKGKYEPFSYDAHCVGHVNRDAAIATAAYRILKTRTPGRAAYLDAQYATTIDAIPNGYRKTAGIELGEDVAAHYLALRANDNLTNTYTWTQPTPGPGVWEPTAAAPPADYRVAFVPPWTFPISQTSNFYPPPPPSLTSNVYTASWTEIRDFGRNTSTVRTEDQRQLALWTAESPFRWGARNWNRLVVDKGLSDIEAARFFAYAYTASADTLQTGQSAKYYYNFWRPFHSVPRADTDGNAATTADPTWAPLLNVNHPEYPAGHGVFGAGVYVEATRRFFKTNNINWTLDTVGVAGLTQTSRTYTSLDALAQDISNGRIYAGLHYRFTMDASRPVGRNVARYVDERFYRRARH